MKAIHNKLKGLFLSMVLWTIHKDTKNESNSQPTLGQTFIYGGCELYTKIQKMKAIHNVMLMHSNVGLAVNYTQRYKKWKQFTTGSTLSYNPAGLWTIHKDTKNESNSQRGGKSPLVVMRCELYTKIQKMKAIHNQAHLLIINFKAVNYTQRYKKWKQFTTFLLQILPSLPLWTIHKDTKNESNSQRTLICLPITVSCELYTKIQKMKAIHNMSPFIIPFIVAVNYTQRYKKWKQFTTLPIILNYSQRLWTIHKDTKNESNSQQIYVRSASIIAVNYTQRYKKWKQFTTFKSLEL